MNSITRETAIQYAKLLKIFIGLSEVSIILNTFVKALLAKCILKKDGVWYLHGSFNLGGTVSGRLSSSKPNLTNIPSTGSAYAKHIKRCFKAAYGFIFGGADFDSLEDRVSALTTKDTNKLRVYIDGYDGHCLRAYSYFGSEMPGICNTLESINSIKHKFPDLRQRSKMPTFALTYAGTWVTLVNNEGFTEAEAKHIEAQYHTLYRESDEYVQAKMVQATHDGYVTGAFGLRLRTPILAQCILNTNYTPYEAQAESRTAGNMLGQSYGILNNRAANEFMDRVYKSEFRYDIHPIALIHDAIYLIWPDKLKITHWVNKNIAECMAWQELEDIKHPQVKLSGSLELFYPDWANSISLENNASKGLIRSTVLEGIREYNEKLL